MAQPVLLLDTLQNNTHLIVDNLHISAIASDKSQVAAIGIGQFCGCLHRLVEDVFDDASYSDSLN
jgi:hypothetical protein